MIEISNLTFGYSKNQLLFKDLNLRLSKGHIYGLLGKNGAGKSTLLRNIAGLLHPREGHCKVNGLSADSRTPAFLQELFFIPEELYLPDVTVSGFVKSTAHFYPKFDEAAFYKVLSDFDVPEISKIKHLSYGQQKKIMIAFGLATNTSLLIMDEPTNGLDIPSKVQFRKAIAAALNEDRCIIISTHQVRDLDSLIDVVLVLDQQEIVLYKSIDELQEMAISRGEASAKLDMEVLFNSAISGHK
ncbi:ABC transporter ATP-binding protein [Pedobacter frigoris]|uniref:ABC transporter ATP-binding protein n=1 Tax=Pedobacter frigoris TaxID=2571272 RepID=A0A4U1C904_9SPHI|nr:ABC transporter ATP-binding protein [Pedobacter frigoris]TKC02853.1 ABC transporter ATP-binding protein [Pedobacter frigoris]